jgi:hypothetical protein
MNNMRNVTLKTKLTILTALTLLVFASASEALSRYISTVSEDTVTCTPQKDSSANLWTCYDYYGNEFKNLLILSKE